MVPVMGPGPGVVPHPFHCWTMLRTCQILNFMIFMTEQAHIQGEGTVMLELLFHCWMSRERETSDHFLSRKPQIHKRAKRHYASQRFLAFC